jgi:MoaA/NifB/PqqE/SkfB family radical SAM enzyme
MSKKVLSYLTQPTYLVRTVAAAKLSEQFSPRQIQPLEAHLLLTENCNSRCITCDYWKKRWTNSISTDLAVETINKLGEIGIQYIRFSGGDPFLRSDFFEILQRANFQPFRKVRVQTNALLMKKYAKKINTSPITNVTVSLDGTGEINDSIRGIKGYYNNALKGLVKLQNKKISIACTLTGPGAACLEELIDQAKRNGWQFAYNLLNNKIYKYPNAEINTLWPDSETTNKIIQILKHHLNLPSYELNYIRMHYDSGPNRKYGAEEAPCLLGYTTVYVNSSGNIFSGCYSLPPMGNILEDDLRIILQSQKYKNRCLSMLRRECKGCVCNYRLSLMAQNYQGWLFHKAKIAIKLN